MTEIGDLIEIPKEIIFEWKIRDFLSLSDVMNTRYDSSKFYFAGASWILQIFPNGQEEDNLDWIGLWIARRSSGFPITVNYSFGFKNIDGKINNEESFTDTLEEEFVRTGIDKFIQRATLMEKKSQLLPENNLTVVCSLKSREPNSVSNSLFRRHQDICSNLRHIYINAKKTDLELKFNDNRKLRAHQMILEARSPVFAAMFNHDTKEKKTGEISIKDVDIYIMDTLLSYLYSGDIPTPTTENAISLYAAADKYDIEYVRLMCHDFIIRNLSADWITDVIAFSELYQLDEVSHRAKEYFKENADKILESEKWKNFVKENHDMGVELLGSLVKSLLPRNSPK